MNPIKIGFILLSNSERPQPSTRIAALNMFPFLRAENFEPHIVFQPENGTETPDVSHLAPRLIAEKFKIVVFQKVHGPSVERLARDLSDAGIKTVYSVCDLIKVGMAEATDSTVVISEYLKSLYPQSLHSKINTVHDGIEALEVRKTDWSAHSGSRRSPLRAVLVTSASLDRLPQIGVPPDWLQVTILGRYPESNQILQRVREAKRNLECKQSFKDRVAYLKFLGTNRIRCIAWSQTKAYELMQQADIGIIPIETSPEHLPGTPPPHWKVKSENRLTMKMCIGLPVIATPIPAYEPIINHGNNGFLARSPKEWDRFLGALRDPDFRRSVGERARESVCDAYSMAEQARRLTCVFKALVPSSVPQSYANHDQ